MTTQTHLSHVSANANSISNGVKNTAQKMARTLQLKELKNKQNIENKIFHCTPCNKSFRDKTSLTIHLRHKKHRPESYVKYSCDLCLFTTKNKSIYKKHTQTKKHIRRISHVSANENSISNGVKNTG